MAIIDTLLRCGNCLLSLVSDPWATISLVFFVVVPVPFSPNGRLILIKFVPVVLNFNANRYFTFICHARDYFCDDIITSGWMWDCFFFVLLLPKFSIFSRSLLFEGGG